MKKYSIIVVFIILLISCFDAPDIAPPQFIPKSPPDSLIETGIDAHSDNAIYLEWEEPATAPEEGITSYYIYRGKLINGEYEFEYLDEVIRNSGVIYESDNYIDYDANLDTTYYYYLTSHNNFTESRQTSDTVCYKLRFKPTLFEPAGDIYTNQPIWNFRYPNLVIDRIDNFYLRIEYFEGNRYNTKYYIRIFRYDLSKVEYKYYLNIYDSHTTIIYDELEKLNGNRILSKGDYRWRVDAIASELGGAPEKEGSESAWMYFTVK